MKQNVEHGKKRGATRSISFILALVFVFSIFSGTIYAKDVPKESNSFLLSEDTEFDISSETPLAIQSATAKCPVGGKTWTWKTSAIKIPGWLKKILPKPSIKFCWYSTVNEWVSVKVCEITCKETGAKKCWFVPKKNNYKKKFCFTIDPPAEMSGDIISKIYPSDSATHRVIVDPTASWMNSYINWAEGDLDLVLYSPNGVRIDPSVAAIDTNVSYGKGMIDDLSMAIYVIQNPEPGDWTMEITAIDVPTEGEDYYAAAYLVSNISQTLSTDKEGYNQFEPISLRVDLSYGGIPLTGALVTLDIQKSDATIDNIPLFDDGSHGDIQAGDGTYSNMYTDTNVGGQYNLIVYSSGTTPDSYPFTRTVSKLVVVDTRKAKFCDIYSDHGTDIDGNELYNYLTVTMEINVMSAGNYTLEGWLYDINGREIVSAYNNTNLDVGNQTISLNFDGLQIYKHEAFGPFNLGYLLFLDKNNTLVDYRYDAYNTTLYNYTDFQVPLAEFTRDYADYGIDSDGDGLYDYLAIDVGVNVITPGSYSVDGYLYDVNGDEIVWSIDHDSLDVGTHTMHLDFDGKSIQMRGVDGPYYLKDIILSGENWTFADYISDAYNTSAYNSSDFVDPVRTEEGISGNGSGELALTVTVKDTVPVYSGRYSYDIVGINVPPISTPWNRTTPGYGYEFPGVSIPGKPNNYTVTAAGVENLNIGLKQLRGNSTRTWITTRIDAAEDGRATLETDLISPGSYYHVKIFGDAAENVSQVDLTMTLVKNIIVNGKFNLSIDTTGFPSADYSIALKALNGSFCFDEIGFDGLLLAP